MARDPRLGRDVALKVSAQQFTERFAREARIVASLNHPNICTLHDVGPNYLVMELVEGPTLAERIAKGALPLEEALKVAAQIGDALEAAHDKGITHRDLKPGNIKIRPDGTVKVLDFGLAKVGVGPASSGENSPTLTIGATVAGVILGTAGYMSPEQARGEPVDKRADIWAYGVVLHEMLTAERLFEGKTVSDTLAAVLMKEPDLEGVPTKAQRLVRACLERDPKRRLRDIGEAWRLLADEVPLEPAPAPKFGSSLGRKMALGTLAAAAIAALGVSVVHFREQVPQPQVLLYTVAPPEKTRPTSLALSPDGHYLVMATQGERGFQLWVRALDSLQTQALPGTEDAIFPFWSPDSRYIGFFAQGKLKKIAATGGPTQTLSDAPNARGGTWSGEGVIVFASSDGGGLSRVPAVGGVPAPITKAEGSSYRFPVFLPDNRRFLYQVTNGKENGIYLASLDGKEHRRILQDDSEPRYLPPAAGTPNGYLLFRREQTLMAQPMDPKSMQTNGDVFPAAEQVARSFTSAANDLFSISGSGVLIYRTGLARGGEYQYAWFDRAGKEAGVIGSRVQSIHFALSPDAKRVIIQRVTGSNSDLWMTDLDHKTESRFTFDPSTNERPVWSPDGSQVVFGSTRGGAGGNPDLYQKASNGVGQDQPLLQSPDGKYPFDWSRDGRFLIFVNNSQKTNLDVFALPMSGTGDRKPIRLVQGPFRDWMGQLSPDQRWLAYCSDESGRPEVYVQPFAPADAASGKPVSGKWQISTAGGTQPRWRADGKEFFYVAPDRKLMSVEVKTAGPSFDHSTAQPLFELRANVSDRYVYRYAPAPDGKRFLVSTELEGSDEAQPLTIVVNWLAAIKK